ncbi:PaaR repeat-containing protein [Klebsiella pneumoniae]|nr:PaaR repeat-containing protein [Klebsiella pneumoniae]
MNKVIRKGDTLREYGGRVLMGALSVFLVWGSPARATRSSVTNTGMTTIAEGSARTTIDGQPVALHGHRCACGCTLVSSNPDCGVDQ